MKQEAHVFVVFSAVWFAFSQKARASEKKEDTNIVQYPEENEFESQKRESVALWLLR